MHFNSEIKLSNRNQVEILHMFMHAILLSLNTSNYQPVAGKKQIVFSENKKNVFLKLSDHDLDPSPTYGPSIYERYLF